VLCVIVVDKVPDGADMIGHLLRKRECSAHQSTTALAQRIVEPFNVIGLASVLPDCSVPFGGQDSGICLPKIAVTDRTLAVDWWKAGPQPACGGFCPRPNRHADNFARGAIDREPDPFLVTLGADK
jgi:hypothetical protein